LEKLTDEELSKLRELLIRYLAEQAAEWTYAAIEAISARLKRNPVIDVTPLRPPPVKVARKRSLNIL
jgi:hypothetical protein